MRALVALIAVAGLAACSPPADGPAEPTETGLMSPDDADFTAADLTNLVNVRGAEDAVLELNNGGNPNWQVVLDGIRSGDQAWLYTVPLMHDGLDGEAATQVSIALADALASNAEGVLRLTPMHVSVEEVCLPDPPHEDPASEAEAQARHERKIAGVQAIEAPALSAARAECLEWLQP